MDDALLVADPAPLLAACYRTILDTRMRGLPVVNPALAVEAVGFAPWNACWLGVMLTPWFMNLMLLPRDVRAWTPLPPGTKRTHRFPAGAYEFIGGHDEAIGSYEVCSLFSPVVEFDDHESARLVAQLARDALFDVANADAGEADPASCLKEAIATADASVTASSPGPLARLEAQLDTPMSKRAFLHGLRGAGDGTRR